MNPKKSKVAYSATTVLRGVNAGTVGTAEPLTLKHARDMLGDCSRRALIGLWRFEMEGAVWIPQPVYVVAVL